MPRHHVLTVTCWLVGLGLGLGVEFGVESSPDAGEGEFVDTLPTVGNALAGSACHCLWICCEVSRNRAPLSSHVLWQMYLHTLQQEACLITAWWHKWHGRGLRNCLVRNTWHCGSKSLLTSRWIGWLTLSGLPLLAFPPPPPKHFIHGIPETFPRLYLLFAILASLPPSLSWFFFVFRLFRCCLRFPELLTRFFETLACPVHRAVCMYDGVFFTSKSLLLRIFAGINLSDVSCKVKSREIENYVFRELKISR